MKCTQTGIRSPLVSTSATRTGVMVIGAGAFIGYRPPRWWLICEMTALPVTG